MPNFVLDANGLQTPRFADARQTVVDLWIAGFGANAQTASDSPDGLIIDVVSLLLSLEWEAVEAVHAASYFRTAEGQALEFVLDVFGRQRLDATASTGTGVWYGTASTGVPAGTVGSVEDTGDRFTTDALVTTVASGAGGPIVIRIDEAVSARTYSIDVDATESQIVAATSDSDAIADQIVAQLATDNPSFTISRGGLDPDGLAIIVVEDTGAAVITVGAATTEADDLTIHFGVRTAMTAEETGPDQALSGSLNTIETPVSGIVGVANTADFDAGRDLESDALFRARHLDQLNSGGSGSLPALRARLLNEIAGIEYARIFENDTEVTDGDGRPPHSFEPVVITPGGDDAAIAQVIHDHKAAGIQSYGDTIVPVTSPDGLVRSIGLSRGTELYLHLGVVLTTGEGFPTTGDPHTAVRNAIALYLQRGGGGALGLGTDFYRFVLGAPINITVPGVVSATITTDATANPLDAPTLTASDIVVADDTILRVDTSRIAVT